MSPSTLDVARELLDLIDEGITIADSTGKMLFVNKAGELLTGRGLADGPVETWPDHFGVFLPDGLTKFPADDLPLARAIRGERCRATEMVVRRPIGGALRLSVRANPLPDGRAVAIYSNITNEKEAERKARLLDRLYRMLARNLPNMCVVMFDKDLRFLLAEGPLLEHVGLARDRIEGRALDEVVTPERAQRLRPPYLGALEGYESRFEIPSPDGNRIFEHHVMPVRDESGRVIVGMVVSRDITELRRRESMMRRQVNIDKVTGLPNRTVFESVAQERLSAGERVAMLMLDVDGFKWINDTYGHPSGDAVLISIAARLQRSTREEDTVARISGDEFAVLLTSLTKALPVAERILKNIREPILLPVGVHVDVSVSIGIALAGETLFESYESLRQRADTALYDAKRGGKNQVRLASESS